MMQRAPPGDLERLLLSLPPRLGGLGFTIPTNMSAIEFDASTTVTKPLYDLILQKKTHYPLSVIEAQIQAKKQLHQSKQQQTQDTAANLLPQSSHRSMVLTQEKGASSWLTTLPISEHGFALHKGAFCDALALRNGWDPPNTPSHCIYGKSFTVEHALSCPFGGYPTQCHNEIRNLTANLLSEVCHNELSAQCIVFKKHYVELEATLEAHPLAGILFSQEVISDHELQEIHGATTPFRKNELLLKYLLKSEKDVIPLILDTLKKEPAMEFQHTLIENAFKEASETESESEIEETYTINVAQAFVTSVLHLFHKHTDTDIEMFRVNANTFAKLKGFGISISVPRSSGIYNNLGPSTQMLRSLTFEAEVQIKDDIWIQISKEFADLLIGLNEILSINDKALQNIKQGFKFSSHLPVEGIDNVATISDLLEYIHPVKKIPYSYVDTDLLALTVKFSKDKEAQQLLETFWTCHPPIIHTMDLYLNPVQTHESNNENGCLVPVTVTCCDSTISWNSLKQKKEALCIAFKLPQFALRFSKVSKGSIVIVWEMASNLANIVCSDSIGQECLEMLSQVRIAEIKIGSMLILSIPPLRALQKDDRTPLFTAALYGNEDVVRYLLSQILVNKVDKQQTSALDIAIENEQWNIVELLVTAGGIQGIDAASKVEQLLESCKSGNVFIAKEALQSMIDIDTKNEGKSLLEVAIERKLWDIVSVLRKSGGMDAAEISDILFNASQQGDIMAVERVLRTGVNINSKNKDGETALMLAAHFEQPSIIDLLLFYDADLGMINKLDILIPT
eukprot:Em0001g1468a